MHHIAILDDVAFSFGPHLSRLFRPLLAVAGDEVVQLYLRDVHASVTTPVKQLVRFERVTLQPDETQTVRFELKPIDFSLWNDRMERVVEPGAFKLMAGANSLNVKEVTILLQ